MIRYYGVSGFLLVSIVAIVFISDATSLAPNVGAASTEEEWEARIETIGGKAAYEELEKKAKNLEESQKHVQAHYFGAALYAAEGIKGLSVCDTQFSYGCFHEFLGRAIADLGILSVPELNQKCFEDLGKDGLACQHGIGHGVQAYFGYSEKNLLEALDVCRSVSHADPIGGCVGGVFMEYNFQTMLGREGKVRNSENIFSPCDSIPAEHMEACVFSQPQWWHQSKLVQEVDAKIFKTLGEYCDRLAPSGSSSDICFSGIGNIAPQIFKYKSAAVREGCLLTSNKERSQLACLSNAANVIGVTTNTSDAEKVCDTLQGEALTHCRAYARNEANALLKRALPSL